MGQNEREETIEPKGKSYSSDTKDVDFVTTGKINTSGVAAPTTTRKKGELTPSQLKTIQCVYYGQGVFRGRDNLYKHLRGLNLKDPLTKRQVAGWLKKQEIWQTSRRQPREKTFRPFIPKGPRDVLQIDLIGPIRGCGTAENPGNRYAIIVVDLFTRKMWSAAIKEKTAAATWKGFKKMLNSSVFQGPHKMRKKWHLSSDNGKEFQADFSTGLESYSNKSTIVQVFGVSGKSTNQAYVERSNQTVKSLLYKLMATHKNKCFTSFLQKATHNYNNGYHRVIKMTPEEADSSDDPKVVREVRKTLKKAFSEIELKEDSTTLEADDYVRIRVNKSALAHQYLDNYTSQVYRVHEVFTPKTKNGLFKYTVYYTDPQGNIQLKRESKKTPPMRFTRDLLLKIVDGNPQPPPEDMATFKKFCEQCKRDNPEACFNYDTYLKDARNTRNKLQKQNAREKSQNVQQKNEKLFKESLDVLKTKNLPYETYKFALGVVNSELKKQVHDKTRVGEEGIKKIVQRFREGISNGMTSTRVSDADKKLLENKKKTVETYLKRQKLAKSTLT